MRELADELLPIDDPGFSKCTEITVPPAAIVCDLTLSWEEIIRKISRVKFYMVSFTKKRQARLQGSSPSRIYLYVLILKGGGSKETPMFEHLP